jgi:hypothetical protein
MHAPDAADTSKHYRFPMYVLCYREDGEELIVDVELENLLCVCFYHNKELAELAVEQADTKDGPCHHLSRIDDKARLIEVLTAIPREVGNIIWNKQLEAAGTFELQAINCFLGWVIRHT